MMEYTNTKISNVIDEYIHDEKHRQILKRRYVDGMTFEKLSEEFSMSVRQIKNIVYKHEATIFKHL